MHSGPPLGVPKERCRSVVCSEALLVLCKVCAVLNMGNVRTSSETATRKLRRSRRLHIQLPDHRQNEPQRNRRLGAASRSRSNSRTYRYRTTQLRTICRRPKTPPEDSTADMSRQETSNGCTVGPPHGSPPQPRNRHHRRERWGELAQSPAHPGQPEGVAGLGGHHSSTPNVDRRRFYTVSSTLWMSRYGPLYPRSQSTPASGP